MTYLSEVTTSGVQDDPPTHRVHIHNMKGSWTPSNRNVALSLYDGYTKAQTIRKCLSAEALKAFKVDKASKTSQVTCRHLSQCCTAVKKPMKFPGVFYYCFSSIIEFIIH